MIPGLIKTISPLVSNRFDTSRKEEQNLNKNHFINNRYTIDELNLNFRMCTQFPHPISIFTA